MALRFRSSLDKASLYYTPSSIRRRGVFCGGLRTAPRHHKGIKSPTAAQRKLSVLPVSLGSMAQRGLRIRVGERIQECNDIVDLGIVPGGCGSLLARQRLVAHVNVGLEGPR